DGIRDRNVTGVQTCALPIWPLGEARVKLLAYLLGDGTLTGARPRFTNGSEKLRADFREAVGRFGGLAVREETPGDRTPTLAVSEIGRASCRERVESWVGARW